MRQRRPSRHDRALYRFHSVSFEHRKRNSRHLRSWGHLRLHRDIIWGRNQHIFHGNIGGNTVHIKTSWAGRKAVCKQWLAPSQLRFFRTLPPPSTGGTSGATEATRPEGMPDIGMADQFQSSSAFFGLYRGITYPTLPESPNSPVGIVHLSSWRIGERQLV